MYDIVITGAAGFIGYHLAEQLTRDGNKRALLLDNFSVGTRCEMFAALVARPNVTFVEEAVSTGVSASRGGRDTWAGRCDHIMLAA